MPQIKTIFITLIALLIGVGIGMYGRNLYHYFKEKTETLYNKATLSIDSKNVDQLSITVSKDDWEKLRKQRDEGLTHKIFLKPDSAFVSATIEYKNESYKARLRLKGDFTDHLDSDKWSLRINLEEGNIMAMKKFSLQHPKTRNYIHEWLFHQILNMQHIVSLRYHFIEVKINGVDYGIYALEEFFDEAILENHSLEKGLILKFDEDLLWKERSRYYDKGIEKDEMAQQMILQFPETTFATAFNLSAIEKDSLRYSQFIKARNQLNRFLSNQLDADKVFDLNKMASYIALCEIMGAKHALVWHNLRFYYNPETKLLEPIGFDAEAGNVISEPPTSLFDLFHHHDAIWQRLFKNIHFSELYIQALHLYSNKIFLDSTFALLENDISQQLSILKTEWPDYEISTDNYYKNQTLIQLAINPLKALQAYTIEKNANNIKLEVGLMYNMPIEILGIELKDSLLFVPEKGSDCVLYKNSFREPVVYDTLTFVSTKNISINNLDPDKLKLRYKIIGTNEVKEERINMYKRTSFQ